MVMKSAQRETQREREREREIIIYCVEGALLDHVAFCFFVSFFT
jgi:hypothetical protein